jgi:hypothetical protein
MNQPEPYCAGSAVYKNNLYAVNVTARAVEWVA